MGAQATQIGRADSVSDITSSTVYEIMSKKEIATVAEWREMAAEARELRDRLGQLILKSSKYVPTTVTAKLHRSQDALDAWRSSAEDEMFHRGGPKDTRIFYPGKL